MSKVKLKNISKLINSGLTPLRSNPSFWDRGNVPWLKTEQLGVKYIYDTNEKITGEAINKTSIKINPINTISIAMYGEGRTRGNVSILKKEMTTNQACCNIVLDEKKANYEYIYYFLKTKYQNLRSLSSGVRKNLNSEDIKNFEVVLPEKIEDQQKIASVLSTLDAKIELNNKINSELEAMAKTLYDYWFVQFDFPCLPENYKFSGASKPANFESVLTYTQVGGLPLPDGKKWFVYVILCEDGSFYKGITNDLYRRYYEHKTGQGAEWTKTHKPKKIIHYEEFETQNEAAEREKELKTGYGRTWLQREYDKFLAAKENNLPAPKDGDGSPAPRFACKLRMAGKMVWSEELKRDIPEGWEVKRIGDLLEKFTDTSKKIPSKEILEKGNYPVITQDAGSFISGYTNEENPITNIPMIIFGDHSCTLRYVDFPFFRGADGTQILTFELDLVFYVYQFLENSIVKLPNYGKYERHYKYLKELLLVIPEKTLSVLFSEKVKPILEKKKNILFENQKLAEIRDFLLPMLMNGQVVVN